MQTNYSQYRQGVTMYTICKKSLFYYVQVQTTEGATYQGIPVEVDQQNMTMLMPEEVELEPNTQEEMDDNGQESRQFGWYGFPRRRGLFYRRRLFPLAGLAALSIVPFLFSSPYYYPYSYYGGPFY